VRKFLFLSLVLFSACTESPKPNGEELSKIYCSSCHQYPKPELLDKATWKDYILPRMGYMYGIYDSDSTRESLFENNEGGELVKARGVFPENRRLDEKTWKAIRDYYLNNSPESLEQKTRQELKMDLLTNFKLCKPELVLRPPAVTMVKLIGDKILVGDANKGALFLINQELQTINAAMVKEGAVHVEMVEEDYWLTVMGSFSPGDDPKGMILKLDVNGKKPAEIPVKDLQRPVHSSYEDLNQDGMVDIVVCEFGKWTGALSLWLSNPKGGYDRMNLSSESGAIKAYIRDMNRDGKKDVVALFGQGNEGIRVYFNEGEKYREEYLLRFPPSYGSSFFNFQDVDQDGDDDIVYCAGDNADYLPILKPYHGIYLFENNEGNFTQKEFITMDGAYAAYYSDFDSDNDQDVVAISFFPDYVNSPERSFVLFEREEGSFIERSFEGVLDSRWIVMDVADIENDGDQDIILGGLTFETVPDVGLLDRWVEKGLPFVVLENQSR